MSKPKRQNLIILTVVIAIAIITAAFFTMAVGREIIIESETYSAEKRTEQIKNKLLKECDHYTGQNAYVEGYINEDNRTSIIAAVTHDTDEVLKLYINYNEIGIYEPVSALTSELNRMYEKDTETLLIEFCIENGLEYENSTISDMKWGKFISWLDEL